MPAAKKSDSELINQKISLIIKELGAIKKERKNQKQNWNFRGIDDVLNSLNPLLAKHGVHIRPIDATIFKHDQVKSRSGSDGYHNITFYTFRIEAEDGSYRDARAIGECIDFGDKSIGKSASYAFKNMCFQTFCIATEDIQDPDTDRPEIKHQSQDDIKNPGDVIFDPQNPQHADMLGGILSTKKIEPDLHEAIARALAGKIWNGTNIADAIRRFKQ